MRRLWRAVAGTAIGALLVLLAAPALPATAAAGRPSDRSFFVTVPDSPGSSDTIRLDASLFTPAVTPAPAVLLAHGFGQTKTDLVPEARRLQAEGYVVLTYTARGFGRSGGRIGLDSLDGEVPDARAMVDVLARDRAVERRGADPVVGVVGGSYGGALALMLGATDPRIDTVVAAITWHDLGDALAPRSAGRVEGAAASPLRDFKVGWAARLFGAGITGATDGCGRFTAAFCDLYGRLVDGGTATAADLALLTRSSPSAVLDRSTAPTLLLQGVQDRLFGLDQSDANARQLRAAGAPVQVRWFNGGHDGGGITGTDVLVDDWLADHLRAAKPVAHRFSFAVPASATAFPEKRVADRYPGLGGTGTTRIPLRGAAQTVVNPPGGRPASVTGIPGLGTTTSIGRTASSLLAAANPPAEAATFASAPLRSATVLTGAATVRLRVDPAAERPVVLYAQLSVRTGDADRALPGGVAPIRTVVPAAGAVVDVTLPATTWNLARGDRLVLTVRSSDDQFVGSRTPSGTGIEVAGPIVLPRVAIVAADRTAGLPSRGVLIGIVAALVVALALLVLGAVLAHRAGRVPAPVEDRQQEGPPLEIAGLRKRFRGGFLAVDDVGFTVERGQVLGLLGENGAGKTTTLRMVAGLLRPDAGTVRAFGLPLGPGSPALDRIGCFIEGPGFLPHLSGLRNLELYWAATGRPKRDAHLEEALAVADLGGAIRKPVRGYSQGMRQRLAIAQAMLGRPDLLVLDEPTNGLDPPQITALRGVLRRYAEEGRTVVVSSHLLGEVERTCSHVVVMSHGRVVAAGPVEAVAGEASELVLDVTDPAAAIAAALAAGAVAAEPHGAAIRVQPGDVPVETIVAAVVAAGVGVRSVGRGRHLEEAFLELIGATEPSS